MTTQTKPRQLTYMERTAAFPLTFDIVHDAAGKPQVKVPIAWETGTLIRIGPYSTGKLVFTPRVHLHAAPVLSAFFRAVALAGVLGDILTYDGGYVPRLKRGVTLPPAGASKDVWGKELSNHSRGCAIDVNASLNAMGKPGAEDGAPGSLHRIIAIARTIKVEIETPAGHVWNAGIVSGSDWHGATRDDQHFEVGTWGVDICDQYFWSFVRMGEADACWEWKGSRFTTPGANYGRMMGQKAHRLAYELHTGCSPGGMFVLHSCDNPPCVNPAHLHLGTPADNMREKRERGRAGKCWGEQHGNAVLTDEQCDDIRARSDRGETCMSIHKSYPEASYGGVWCIAKRKTRTNGSKRTGPRLETVQP